MDARDHRARLAMRHTHNSRAPGVAPRPPIQAECSAGVNRRDQSCAVLGAGVLRTCRATKTQRIAKHAPAVSTRKSLTRACLVGRVTRSNSIPAQKKTAKNISRINERRYPMAKAPPTIAKAVRCSSNCPAPVTGRSAAGTTDKMIIARIPIHAIMRAILVK